MEGKMRSGVQEVGAEVEWGWAAGSGLWDGCGVLGGVAPEGAAPRSARGPPKAGLAASLIYFNKYIKQCKMWFIS